VCPLLTLQMTHLESTRAGWGRQRLSAAD
jgi:hypothetical protein